MLGNLIEPLQRPSRKQHYVRFGELEEIDGADEGDEDEDDGNISIKSGDSLNVPFVAEPQPNTLKRSLVRFGISYQELCERPNYWTIEKAMKGFEEIK